MASPSALAVVRLIAKSHLVGCSTGNSAAFVPRRILSTNSPAQRGQVWAVGHQRAYFNVFAKTAYRCYPCTQRQGADANPVGIDERVADHVECLGVAPHRFKARSNVVHSADFDFDCVETEASRRRVGLLQFDERWRVSSVSNNRKPTKARHDFAQQLDALACKLVLLHGNARDVAAGTVEARDKAGANRVGHQAHDRNRRGHLLCSERHIGCRSSDEIDLHPDKFGDNLGGAVGASFRKPILEGDGAAFDPAEFAQTVHQGGKPLAVGRARAWYEHADERLFRRLLRSRRDRPRRCAAESQDEIAPSHSITSSAATRSLSGTVRPSILAVEALMTSSNLLACTTGSSAGLAPLRMRPV